MLLAAVAVAGCASARAAPQPRSARAAAGGVTTRVVTFVDSSRTILLPHHHREPRTLVTVIRYPTGSTGPLPLIVFGHGFAVTPALYWRLLTAWAAAGYVVAAPVFPRANAHAPGGPDEADIINQPADMSFVISSVLALARVPGSILAGRVDPTAIGVSGHSDGGETALAMAYDRSYRDPRVRAAAILSGAELPNEAAVYFPRPSPPLLASQGTADTTNHPHFTYDFYAAAHRPKYLLRLLGAAHLPPYTTQQPQLDIVERVTTAFFDRYLKHDSAAQRRITADGDVTHLAALTADP